MFLSFIFIFTCFTKTSLSVRASFANRDTDKNKEKEFVDFFLVCMYEICTQNVLMKKRVILHKMSQSLGFLTSEKRRRYFPNRCRPMKYLWNSRSQAVGPWRAVILVFKCCDSQRAHFKRLIIKTSMADCKWKQPEQWGNHSISQVQLMLSLKCWKFFLSTPLTECVSFQATLFLLTWN